MKIALATTTITVPTVLELYRKLAPELGIFIAGDLKSPHADIEQLCNRLGGRYLHPDSQKKWKCSELISWGNIQRRNIAYLEALQWGADVIYTCDTDDLPLRADHFSVIGTLLSQPFNGLELRSSSTWVDPGWLIDPPASHRGMPIRLDRFYCEPAIDRNVAVAASTVLGSCDISATDRISGFAKRHSASVLASPGVIIDPSRSRTLFNSEAVAFTREIAPACSVLSGVGRYDDLFGSLLAQRVMQERGLCVHVGEPVVWHERADRDLTSDVENELWGMKNIKVFIAHLDAHKFPRSAKSVIDMVRWYATSVYSPLPLPTLQTLAAWCDDCAEAMG